MKCFQTLSGTASPQTVNSRPLQGQPDIFVKPEDYLMWLVIRDMNKLSLCENFTWKCGFFLTKGRFYLYIFLLVESSEVI